MKADLAGGAAGSVTDAGAVDVDRLATVVRRVGLAAAVIVALTGGGVLIGLWLDLPVLQGAVAGRTPMRANTALALVASAAAILLWAYGHTRPIPAAPGRLLGLLVLAIAATALIERGTGTELHVDRLVAPTNPRIGGDFPGAPSATTAVALILVGLALLLPDTAVRGVWIAHVCAVLIAAIGFLAAVDLTFGVDVYDARVSHMAPPTALCLVLLAGALLLIRPERGVVRWSTVRSPGGDLVRRALPSVLVIPLLPWFAADLGRRTGAYRDATGQALLAAAFTSVLVAGVLLFARTLDRRDTQRRHTERALRAKEHGVEVERSHAMAELNLIHPDDRSDTHAAREKALTGVPVSGFENRYRHADGSYRWLDWRVLTGPRNIAYGVARDVTEEKEQDRVIQGLLDTAPDAMVIVGEDGRVQRVNEQAVTLLGYQPGELVGQPVESLMPAGQRERHERLRRDYLAAPCRRTVGGVDRCLATLRKDGTTFPAEIILSALDTPDGTLVSAVIRDMTERLSVQDRLTRARDEAVEASRLKSEFLATMSHEIRTPMNGVIGLTGLLLESGQLDRTQRTYVEGVQTAGKALLSIINDILDFSKIEAGKFTLDEVEFRVPDVIAEVAELVGQAARVKGLTVSTPTSAGMPRTVGDPGRLRQVLLNMANNAVKFTNGGQVTLRAAPVEAPPPGVPVAEGKVWVHFEVSDTGIGIPPDKIKNLFEPFSQADASTTTRFGGTGLGLAICRRLIDAMGGRFGVDTRAGAGSTFWFTVPLGTVAGRRTATAHPAGIPADPLSLAGRTVLIVGVDDPTRSVLAGWLQGWEIQLRTVRTGRQAVQTVRDAADDKPSLAIVESRLPDMAGTDLARQLAAAAPLPVVLLSPDGLLDLDAAHRAGVRATLGKPVHRSQLYDCLTRLLSDEPAPVATDRPGAVPPGAVPPGGVPAGGSDELPVDGRAGPARPPIGGDRWKPAGSGRILLVEDNEINQLVAAGVLERLGLDADLATNGAEAVRLAGCRSYSAVLMDIRMPVMDGYAATEAIRRAEGDNRHTPIIAMTASAQQSDRDHCLAIGMDDYIPKPFSPTELSEVVTRAIESGRRSPGSGSGNGSGSGSGDRPVGELIRARLNELGAPDLAAAHDVLIGVISAFQCKGPAHLETLAAAIEANDSAAVRREAHSFKGAAANLGAQPLADACAALEEGVGGSDFSGPGTLLARVCAEHERTQAALAEIVLTLPERR